MKFISPKNSGGFTIVEVSIVLAVMAVLIIAALNSVTGKPSMDRFQTSASDFKTSLEQIINQTTNGQNADNGDYSCTGGDSGPTHPSITGAPKAQGTNIGCIFLGKVVQFNPNIGGTPKPAQFIAYPVVGNQFLNSGGLTDTIADSYPYLVNYDSQSFSVENGLKVYSINAQTSSTGPLISTASIAILAGDSTGKLYSTSGSNLNNGPEPSSLYYDTETHYNSGSGLTETNLANDVDDSINMYPSLHTGFAYAAQVTICVTNGTLSASIQIGENGGLNDTLKIWNDSTC